MPYRDKEKRKEYKKKYRLENKERLALYNKKYRLENKERLTLYNKEYRLENKERLTLYSKKYCLENKERLNKKAEKYRLENREILRIKAKKFRLENKERVNECNAKRNRERYHSDVEYKLTHNLRGSLRGKLKYHLANKNSSALSLVGCTMEELKDHIESKFEDGMSWENWTVDGWHLDHIIPCSSFDLKIEEEQKKCFHYTNLQPLWAKDNLSKTNKINWSKNDEANT